MRSLLVAIALVASIVVSGAPALAQPGVPIIPAKDSGCPKNIEAEIVSLFHPDSLPTRPLLLCSKIQVPAPTETEPNKVLQKWAVDVGFKDSHIRVDVADDGTIETVHCPVAIMQSVAKRFGIAETRDPTQAPPPIKCSAGSAGGQLTVEVPGKAVIQMQVDGKVVSAVMGNDDVLESGSSLMALLFWAFAAATIGGALFVITRRNLIAAVMGMVGSFMGIAAVYMMLYAQFLAVIQMLVYAGAIMVLFVFVIMILNRPEDEPIAPSGRAGQTIGVLAILYLVFRLSMLLMHVHAPNGDAALQAPSPLPVPAPGVGFHDWGSVRAVGTDLFGPGLFPFETISILLLIAVVGAIAIARPLKDDEP
jgi:NADH-quinone oxidoreductase subunit J